MIEIKATFCSVNNLLHADIWTSFLLDVEDCLDEKLSRLDVNDPIRKKVEDIDNVGCFICSIGQKEDSRWLFGKFGRSKVELSMSLYRDSSRFCNSVSFYFPAKFLKNTENLELVAKIFEIGNQHLKPFYSYADDLNQIAAKRKVTRMAVDLEVELGGMFWLTYLNNKYLDFFGNTKLEKLSGSYTLDESNYGATFRFGKLPASAESVELRLAAEETLGKESFVNPQLPFDRPRGSQALTYEQLAE